MNNEQMTERTEERTLGIVAAEIRALTASMLCNVIEIGRRMCEAKEMLGHGEFLPWIEEHTGYSKSTANNFMRLFKEYGESQQSLFGTGVSNVQTYGHLSVSKALALLALPAGEREEFVAETDVDAMSTRELQEAIRAREEAEQKLNETSDALIEAKGRIRELEERPVEVAVQVDEEACKRAADEAQKAADEKWQKEVERLKKKLEGVEKLRDKAEQAAKDAVSAAEAETLKKEAERLRAELEAAKREQKSAAVAGDADLAAFKLLFERAQEEINRMNGLMQKVRGREDGAEVAEKIRKALLALAEATRRCAE